MIGFGALIAVVALTAQPDADKLADRVTTTADAVGMAVADAALLPPEQRIYTRYLWVPPWGNDSWHRVNSFAVNTAVSHASTIQLPDGAGAGWLIRWDLQRLAPKERDLIRLVELWDSLADQDPYFHFKGKASPARVRVKVAPYRASDGKVYDFKVVDGQLFGTIPAPHLAEQHAALTTLIPCRAPILRADWFLTKVLSTIEGGRYYDFIGFNGPDGRRLNETQILRVVGADTALSRDTNSANRVGMFESGVTGKARTVEAGQGTVGDWFVTFDLFDEDTDAARHPIYNLAAFVDNARGKEIIFARANGLHAFVLTNGAGQLVDEAPPNLASDHDIPSPHTKRLVPAIGCIRCHGSSDGLQPASNDVAKLLAGGRLDVFDDLGNLKNSRFENVDQLASFYAGTKFDDRLRTGRDNYSKAVFAATRGLGVPEVSDFTAQQFGAYRYAKVTPDQAAMELGWKVKKAGDGAAVLRANVADLQAGGLIVDGKSLSVADPTVAALLGDEVKNPKGMAVRRADFERVFVDMSLQGGKAVKK